MSRSLVGLLAAALVATVGNPGAAQDPKAEKEKLPQVAVNDPAKLADDLDFAIQGEYLGKRDGVALGAQVVALGDGQFKVKLYPGGLPGAGWDGTPPTAGKGTRDRDRVDVKSATKPGETLGVLAPDADTKKRVFTVAGKEAAVLGKIERKSPTLGAKPPKGAVVLFSGPADADKWERATIAELSDGKFLAAGGRTRQNFHSFQLHLEFRTPWVPRASGRPRGSGGVFLEDRYELQVLDNFGLTGAEKEADSIYREYELIFNNDVTRMKDVSIAKALENLEVLMGGTFEQGVIRFNQKEIKVRAAPASRRFPEDLENLFVKSERGEMVPYSAFLKIETKQFAPKVNMCFPPMIWQTYDVDFTAAAVDAEGLKTKSAKATVRHNGVVIYDGLELKWNTPGGGNSLKKLTEAGALYLPNYGDPVVFKNIWAVVK
jgi:hypothetical protein